MREIASDPYAQQCTGAGGIAFADTELSVEVENFS
jgi:hypothetical protein